jgi:hypothetical protein
MCTRYVRHVTFQTDGTTPLYVASEEGHVECVRGLLGAGAAVNQENVGCSSSMAWRGGGAVCGDAWEPALMHYWSSVRVDVWELAPCMFGWLGLLLCDVADDLGM